MRYYEIYLSGDREPRITTSIRQLRTLPDGTCILRTITDRDGSLIDQTEIPIADGRPQVRGLGKRRP